jgi:DNA adenine methylase
MLKNKAKPFIKWLGGKSNLSSEIINLIPQEFFYKEFNYIEPFLGSGAFLFHILNEFKNVKKVIVNDINYELINTYKVIKNEPYALISELEILQNQFHELENNQIEREKFYYSKRKIFNEKNLDSIKQAALFIFLNKTCYNGLYRTNKKGQFNAALGRYYKPVILDKENILNVSEKLKNVEILCSDFENVLNYIEKNTLVYLDPPYMPITKTANFTRYVKECFNYKDQIRLKNFCDKLNELNIHFIQSNSNSPEIRELYKNYKIKEVYASRKINIDINKRNKIIELLITNNFEIFNDVLL